eukprot:gene8345-170_t
MNTSSNNSFIENHSEIEAETLTEILQHTKTSVDGISVYEFSQKHKVVGFFIKWIGCPVCQEVIENVGRMFPTFIKLNAVPIIFHQEDPKTVKKYFENNKKDINANYLPFAYASKSLNDVLGIGSASLGSHIEAIMKGNMLGLVLGPKKRVFTIPTKVRNPMSQFAAVSIENGIVKKKVVYSTLYKRVDFGLFMNDIGSTLVSKKNVQRLMNLFPNIVDSKIENQTNTVDRKSTNIDNNEGEIEKTLSDEIGRFYLKAFASNEYSVENILIYEEISFFKGMPLQKNFTIESQIEKAKEIYKNFIVEGSMMELNITRNLAKDYENRIEQFESHHEKNEDLSKFFDDLMKEVRMEILGDTFGRFKKSRYYDEYLDGKHGEKTITYLV